MVFSSKKRWIPRRTANIMYELPMDKTRRTARAGKVIALDTENDASGNLGFWSVAFRDATGRLCVHTTYGVRHQAELKHLFSDLVVLCHNYKWDARVLRRNGLPEPPYHLDSMVMAYCLGMGFQDVKDSSIKKSGDMMVGGLGLKYLARRHLGMDMREWSEIKNAPAEEIMEYNAQDAVATYLLWEQWKDKVPGHFWTIDMPLLDVIMAMEDRGIQVDPNFLRVYAESLDKRLKEFELPLNPFAPEQIRSYVYGTLGTEPFKFTDTGAPSVDASVLETIDDPVVREILDYKSVAKEKSTYASNYIAQTGADGRLHCEFKQVRTATGRLASANPNLQNVVKEGDMRKLFVAPPGHKIIRVDWKQLELMVFAAITQDPIMLGAIEAGRSIHQETADALGLKYDDGKVINFLMLYGGTPWKISMEFHVPIDQAKEIVKTYYRTYPMVKRYHEEQIERARADKQVTNYFGRVRRLDAMYANDWRIRQEGEREAINTPVQGAAGDVVKLAMIDLHKHKAPIILQVHDELLFEIPSRKVRAYAKWLEEYIPTLTDINRVRFPVEVSWGKSWGEQDGKLGKS